MHLLPLIYLSGLTALDTNTVFLCFIDRNLPTASQKKSQIQYILLWRDSVVWRSWRDNSQGSAAEKEVRFKSRSCPPLVSFRPPWVKQRNVVWQSNRGDWTQFCWGKWQPKPKTRGWRRRKEALCCLLLGTLLKHHNPDFFKHTKSSDSTGVAEERTSRRGGCLNYKN